MQVDWRRGRTRRLVGLALLAALGVRSVLARRASGAPVLPDAPLPGRPRLLEALGGTLNHGEVAEAPERVLRRGRTVVGRSRDADLRVLEETVSPRHAALDVEPDGRVTIRDLGALNGVAVDGVPVSEVELHDGNRVTLGDAVLIFRVDPVQDDGGRQGGELGEFADADQT